MNVQVLPDGRATGIGNLVASVAIITRTKNRTILLERAIRSVLSQSQKDWVHVIVNDGGASLPVDTLVEKYRPDYAGRVAVIHHSASLGMEAASNSGIRACHSDFIVVHDDDDTWSPLFIERMLDELNERRKTHHSIRGVICHTMVVKEELLDNKISVNEITNFNEWIKSPIVSLERLALSNIFPPISFVFDRSAAELIVHFDENLPVLGDWDFHLRFCLKYDIAVLPEKLAYYHHRPSANDLSGNSVFVSNSKHKIYREILKNRWLREDLNNHGLGFFVLNANTSRN